MKSTELLEAEIQKWQARLEALPPSPRLIVARHDVPYGRAYRYYNTRGEMIVYMNRGELAELPRQAADVTRRRMTFGIPVVEE